MQGQLIKGHLDFLLLASVKPDGSHGYVIIEELRRRSGAAFDLPEGTVYPALHRLERAGLLASRWSQHNGRRRRVYRLTAKGGRALGRHRQEWPRFQSAVNAVLEPST